MISFRSSLLSAVAALSVFAATSQPAAALVSTYTSNGDVYKVVEYVSSDSEKIRVSTVLKGPGARDTYAARVVPIKTAKFRAWFKPKFGSLVKANAWWFAYMGLISAAGWVYDEASGGVVAADPLAEVGKMWMGENYNYYGYLLTGETPGIACESFGPKLLTRSPSFVSYKASISQSGQSYTCFVKITKNDASVQTFTNLLSKTDCALHLGKTHLYPMANELTTCNGVLPAGSPVSDADLEASIMSQMAADPARAATAFTDPETGKGYADLFDPVPYIPGLSEADEALVNCYLSGQLQMTDAQAACYVPTQLEFDRVKALVDSLAAGRTPESTADALNDDLLQPLTQAQYEETNKKFSDAVSDVTDSVTAQNEFNDSDIDDKFNEMDGLITGLPNTTLPAPANVSVPQYVDCQQLTLSDGNGHDLVFPSPSQCAKIETFKQGFGYFLAISVVFLLCMQLLTRPHG